MDGTIPPPPDGYTLQDSASAIPPPPPGYEIQPASAKDADAGSGIGDFLRKGYEFNDSMGSEKNFLDAAVHHLGNATVGVGQIIAHGLKDSPIGAGLAAGNRLAGGQAGSTDSALDNVSNRFDALVQQREKDYQASTPTNAASIAGATAGEVLPFAIAAPVKGLTTAGEMAGNLVSRAGPLASKIASGATQGAILSGVQPVTEPGNFGSGKLAQIGIGAATGGAIPTVSRGVSEVANLGKAVLNPKAVAAENISRLVGSDPATLAKLDAASFGNIAGVRPTTAQVAPSPSAVAAEKNLGNQPGYKEQLVQRQNENNEARVGVLKNYAGDEASMQAAKDAREAATAPYRENVLKMTEVDTKPILDVISTIKRTGLGVRPTIRTALDSIESTVQSAQDANGKVPAEILDSIRQNINDFLVSPTGKQASAQEKVGVAPIRDQIIKTVGQHAPGYSDYLAAYAKHSTPINTMQAARGILARVDKRALNSTGDAPLSLNDVNQGLAAIEKGRYGVSPQAQKDLKAVQESLKREGISNSIRSPGSDTQYNINAQGSLAKNLLGPTFGGPTTKARVGAATVGALIGEHFGGPGGAAAGAGIGAFINKAADVVNKRIMDHYAAGLLNPQDAATMIRAYLKGNPKQASRLLGRYPQWNALLSGSTQMIQSPQKANP